MRGTNEKGRSSKGKPSAACWIYGFQFIILNWISGFCFFFPIFKVGTATLTVMRGGSYRKIQTGQ